MQSFVKPWQGARVAAGLALLLVLVGTVAAGAGTQQLTIVVRQGQASIPAHSTGQAEAKCKAGEVVTGGGHELQTINPAVTVFGSFPRLATSRWRWDVSVFNDSDVEIVATAIAVCATTAL